jgi:predicted NAD/FAD-dependent oxidoreductase
MFPCGPAQKRVAALSFNSFKRQCGDALRADKELVCVFLTADESRSLLHASESEIYEHCWRLARVFCPELPAQATPYFAIARAEAIPVHEVGRFRRAAALDELAPGPVVFAGDYLTAATVDGALRSGLRAAEQLIS